MTSLTHHHYARSANRSFLHLKVMATHLAVCQQRLDMLYCTCSRIEISIVHDTKYVVYNSSEPDGPSAMIYI